MLDALGAYGIVGVLALLAGVAVVATQNLVMAGGLALVVVGLGLTAWGVVTTALAAMGMDGML